MRKLFLSHWDPDELALIVDELEDIGYVVHTNLDELPGSTSTERADWRLARIEESDTFVLFGQPDTQSLIRNIELGFAIGACVPVAYVGKPRNSYQRYGDVYRDADEFLATWRDSDDFADTAKAS